MINKLDLLEIIRIYFISPRKLDSFKYIEVDSDVSTPCFNSTNSLLEVVDLDLMNFAVNLLPLKNREALKQFVLLDSLKDFWICGNSTSSPDINLVSSAVLSIEYSLFTRMHN